MSNETYLKPVTTTRNLSNGIVQSTTYELIEIFSFGEKVIEKYLDYGLPTQRVKTYQYYTDITENGYGKISQIIDFDGRWTKYEYDSSGRIIKEISPFCDAAIDSPENLCVVITYDYAKLDGSESSDSSDTPRWRTMATFTCGQETRRVFHQYFSNREVEIVATRPGASFSDASNKVTTTYFSNYYDQFCDETIQRTTKVENPDGTVIENTYSDDYYVLEDPWQEIYTTQKTTIHKFLDNILEREVEFKNHFGTVESYRRYYLAEGTELLIEGYDQTIDRNGRPLVKTDIDGNVTSYEYYSAQIPDGDYTNPIPFNHTKTINPDGSVLLEAFDSWDNKIFSLYDGIKTFYHYDVYGNTLDTTVTGRNGGTLTTSTAYNTEGYKISETDANGNVTLYTYGAGWDAKTDALGNVFKNEYYLDGRRKNIKINDSVKNYYTYEIIENELITTEFVSESEWNKAITGFDGNIRQNVYPDGYIQNFLFDEYGRQSIIEDSCGNKTENIYNTVTGELYRRWENGVLTEYSTGYDSDEDDGVYQFERTFSYYQNAQVLTEETKEFRKGLITEIFSKGSVSKSCNTYSGDGVTIETKIENGITTTHTYCYGVLKSSQNAANGLVEYIYDEFNRSIGYNYTEDSVDKSICNVLDNNGNILSVTQAVGADARTIHYSYDALNRKTQETTPAGQSAVYSYDAQGHITAVSGNTYPQNYTYDIQGRVTAITTYRSNTDIETTTFIYDNRGRMQKRIYPDNATEQFTYHGDGNIKCVINSRNQVLGCSYDAFNRLTSVQGNGIYWEFAYDYRGSMIRADNGEYYQDFGYDEYGNLISENFSDIPAELTYFYDGYKRYAGYSFDGRQVRYSYSSDTGILSNISSENWSFAYARVSGGSSISQTITKRNNNIIHSVIRTYNPLGDLTDIGGYGYTVNLDGRRESAVQLDNKVWNYSYDNFNQVVNGVLNNGEMQVSNHSYAYDMIGNRTASNDNGVAKVYAANNLNQYTEISGTEFEYDPDGNLLSDGAFVYEYDAQNQLISISNDTDKEIFVYDFMGRRIATEKYFKSGEEWVLTTRRRYVYQQWNVIAEYVNGIKEKTYIWGEDLSGSLQDAGGVGGLLLEQNSNGEFLPVYDGNGNIIAYKNSNGNTVAAYSYDPFGNVISHIGMVFTYKFSTKPQDDLSGLYYYGYRFYQPNIGRWINRDPSKENGGINLYGFVGCSINNWDILGLDTCTDLPEYSEESGIGPIQKMGLKFRVYGKQSFSPQICKTCCNGKTKKYQKINITGNWYFSIYTGSGKFGFSIGSLSVNLLYGWRAIGTIKASGSMSIVPYFPCSNKDSWSTDFCLGLKGSIRIEGGAAGFVKFKFPLSKPLTAEVSAFLGGVIYARGKICTKCSSTGCEKVRLADVKLDGGIYATASISIGKISYSKKKDILGSS